MFGLNQRMSNMSLTRQTTRQSQPQPQPTRNNEEESYEKLLIPLRKDLYSNNKTVILNSVIKIRQFLSKESNPPINEVIQSGCIPKIIEFLEDFSNSTLQFESCWVVTNIASGTKSHVEVLIKNGAIEKLIYLVQIGEEKVSSQALWCLANIAGDDASFRNTLLDKGIVSSISFLMSKIKQKSNYFLSNASFLISNLCRGKPSPKYSLIVPLLEPILFFITNQHHESKIDSLWALSYFSDISEQSIQAVIDNNFLPILKDCLKSNKKEYFVPSLRTIGNICTGDDFQTQKIIDGGFLPILVQFFYINEPVSIKKEVAWLFSNIACGNKKQVESVYKSGVFEIIVPLILKPDTNGIIQNKQFFKELSFIFGGITSNGLTMDQFKTLIKLKIFQCFDNLLIKTQNDLNAVFQIKDCFTKLQNFAQKNYLDIDKDYKQTNFYKNYIQKDDRSEDAGDRDFKFE